MKLMKKRSFHSAVDGGSASRRVGFPIAAVAVAVQMAATSAVRADGYRFIVSGDPAEVATVGVSTARTAPDALDVREHAAARSPATSLTSVKDPGTMIIIR